MKRLFAATPLLAFLLLSLTACGKNEDKSGVLYIYGAAALISLVLLVVCIGVIRKQRFWFVVLFSSVLVVNIGYTLLSGASCLEMALWANRISYLGSVFLPYSMLMIILQETGTPYKKQLPGCLLAVAVVLFLIAASPGVLPIYYKEVSFAVVNGVGTLIKVYGPLHFLYLIYLSIYFTTMVGTIWCAHSKKTIHTTAHAIVMAIAVLVNIGVWFIEQTVSIEFEFLSISYIISELFLLGVHFVINETRRLQAIVKQVETVHSYPAGESVQADAMLETPIEGNAVAPERIEIFMMGLNTLTPTEKAIYDAYIARATTNEVLAGMNIKESTLKYHNRNLYGKLGVSTRKELLELHKQILSVKAKLDNK